MTRLLPALFALIAAGCATTDGEPESLVDHPVYQAFGSPSWAVAIGDDIALRLGHDHFDAPVVVAIYRYPRALAREWDGVRSWRSVRGASAIVIEARPGPCTSPGGYRFEDNVRVTQGDRVLTGCGGRLLRDERG
jgi:hypothetical protein